MMLPANDTQWFCGRSKLYHSLMAQNQHNYLKIYVTFDFRSHSINQGRSQKRFSLVCKDLRPLTDLSPYDQYIQDRHYWIWKGLKIQSHFIFYFSPTGKGSTGPCHSYFDALILSLPLPEMPFFIKFIIYPSFFSSVSSIASTRWVIPLSQKTIYILMSSKFT